MELIFVCYPQCTTCQKARKWLQKNQIPFTERHIARDNPTADELRLWVRDSGLSVNRFFNTSGLKYRQLNLKEKLPAMSEEEKIALLSTDGMLVKRPIVLGHGLVLVGFRENEWQSLKNWER